eukprot:Gb_02034 [translate_table: standard]
MEECEYPYADKKGVNYNWTKSFGNVNYSANVSPKASARNSYTGDYSSDDYHDVFGGPPKYIFSNNSPKEPRKTHSFLETGLTSSGLAGLPLFEIPVFGETRRRYVSEEFYDDIFNGDTVSNASERSERCSVASRSTSRNLSPVQTPLPRMSEYKTFVTGSPLGPRLRHSANTSRRTEFPLFGTSPPRGAYKSSHDLSNASSVHSSPHTRSSDLLEMHIGRRNKFKKKFFDSKEPLQNEDAFGGLPPRSSTSRSQSFLEQGESLNASIVESPAPENYDKLYPSAHNTSCSNTSDDEWGANIHRVNRRINQRGSKSGVKENNSDIAKSAILAEKGAIALEKARLSTDDVFFMRQQRSAVSSPSQAFVKNCRDWVSKSKGLHSNQDSGSPYVVSVDSLGISSFRGTDTNIGSSSAQEVTQELGSESLDTHGIDSGEESDDFGSYVIEIDAERGETFAFLPEKDIQIDSCKVAAPTKGTIALARSKEKPQRWNVKEGLGKVPIPAESPKDDAKVGNLRGPSAPQSTKFGARASNVDNPLRNVDVRIDSNRVSSGQGRALIKKSSADVIPTEEMVCREDKVEQKMHSAVLPGVAKDRLIKRAAAARDGYSVDISTMVKEVSDRIQRWHCDGPSVCPEISQGSESVDSSKTYSDGASARETLESRRKKLETERQLRTKERVAKTLVEKRQKELEAELEQAEKSKASETLDSGIKRWSTGKEGNIRALLSTLQYVLWPESGWRPVPLIDIIEGAAVRKAYQKARLCVHPDKLQQKGASVQQRYIAEKVFDILQEAWAIYSSLDPF